MRKTMFNRYILNYRKSVLAAGAAALAICGFSSCSDDDMKSPGAGTADCIEKSELKVTSDADYLSRYVTNYKASRSRSGETDVTYTMPVSVPKIPDAAVEYGTINFYWFPDDAAKQAALTSKVTTSTEQPISVLGDMKIYVSDVFTITGSRDVNGASGNVEIYVLPGGSVVFKGNNSNGLAFYTPNSTLTIYNFGDLEAADINNPCNIENTTIHSATPLTIDNIGLGVGANFYAYDGVAVEDLNVYVGAKLYSQCKIIADHKITIDSRAEVSTGYVKSPLIELKGNGTPEKLILRDGGLWEADKILLDNVENIIVGSNTDSYSLIKAGEISVNNIDLTTTFENTYINCTNWTGDNRAKNIDALIFSDSVQLNNDTDIVEVTDDPSSCAPKYAAPAAPAPDPETKPTLEPISKVEMDHTHPISATCIDINGNQAFVSWHERGDNMQGCIEILNIDKATETVTFQAWMETPRWISGSDANKDSAYDFNHLIYDSRTNSIITVGDHAKKGGFVAQIKADAFTTGAGVGENISCLVPRQLPFAASGNSVLRYGEDLYIAGAGGFTIFPFGDGATFAKPENSTKDDIYTRLSECDSLRTSGSAKHLAAYGDMIATIEYTTRSGDTRPARIALWDASSWITGNPSMLTDVPAFGPTYGKDVIALDNEYIYSCQGANGVAVYNLTGAEVARFQVNDYLTKDNGFTDEDRNKMRNSAANGLCVYGDYVFVANGGAGLWVLSKSEGFKPVAHFTDQASYFSQEMQSEIGASANYVRVTDDGYVYVAYGLAGVMVFKFNAD